MGRWGWANGQAKAALMADLRTPLRIDSQTGLPLPDPFPEYLTCPHCGEPEVEVFCYQPMAHCHACGCEFEHPRPPGCGTFAFCKREAESAVGLA